MDIDQMYKKVFGCIVCNKCKNEKPEKYSLLTKTECKEVCLAPPKRSPSIDNEPPPGLSPHGPYVDFYISRLHLSNIT